jgi:hypothetical protein
MRYLVAVAVVYFALYGWLLVTTNGFPYVMDGNESFSSLVHASNMFRFGVTQSFGLTDEAYGPHPDAHPFIYTHQGNFPRLFALLIYVLGARTIETQIIVTTFTVGCLAIFLIFDFFSRRASPLFALVASIVFMTDYVLFAQWHVVTYRVWHAVFLFGSLLCIEAIGGRRRGLWTVVTIVTYAGLFYFEYIFVAFVALTGAAYAAYRYRHRLRILLRVFAAQAGGAVIGLGVLSAQLLAYLGWTGLRQDVFLTYLARNQLGDNSQLLAQLREYYSSHNIVFWYNLGDSTAQRTPGQLVQLLFTWTFQVATPFVTLVAVILVFAWLVARFMPAWSGGRPTAPIVAAGALGFFGFAAGLLVFSVLGSDAFAGVPGGPDVSSTLALVAALAGAILAVVAAWLVSNRHLARLAVGRVLTAGLFLLAISGFVNLQYLLYNQDWQPLWFGQLESRFPGGLERLIVLLAAGLGCVLIIGGMRVLSDGGQRSLNGAAVYLACAAIAYVITYVLSPGYVFSGYLVRDAPLPVFMTDVVLAFAVVVVIAIAARAGASVLAAGTSRPRPALAYIGAAVSGIVLVGLTGFWVSLQQAYVQLLPPNHAAFLEQLARPPYAGASFAVDNYAAPVAIFTGEWAYFDGEIEHGKVQFTSDGYAVGHDADTYVWFADRSKNPDYATPSYFVCFAQQSLSTIVSRLSNPADSGYCGQLGMLGSREPSLQQTALSDWAPHDELLAQDSSPDAWWAIVKLDWDYPPYLKPLAGPTNDTRVDTNVQHSPAGFQIRPQFDAVQQAGTPLLPPVLRLYYGEDQSCVLAETTDAPGFDLPPQFNGTVRVSVRPRTATAVGQEVFGKPVVIGFRRFMLPDTQSGGMQDIQAASIEDAEKIAQSRGTWAPAAAQGLQVFTLPDILLGGAQQVMAPSRADAERIAAAAGTWVQGAGSFGDLSDEADKSGPNLAGYSCRPSAA